MRLYILHHADAIPPAGGDPGIKRRLSGRGRQDTLNLVAFMKKSGESVGRILHVDTSWTKENAELFAAEWGSGTVGATGYTLTAGSDIAPCVADMNSSSENVLLAGPKDVCMNLVSELVAGRRDPSAVVLGNGVCVCIERDVSGSWSIVWMIRPEQMDEKR